MPHANTEAMNAHLAEISRHVAPGAHALLVRDGAGWHGSRSLIVPDNITLMPLPPYSPERNPVENLWQYLRQNTLANRVFDRCDAIANASCAAWNSLMDMPQRLASITRREWAQVKA
jgi:transposase